MSDDTFQIPTINLMDLTSNDIYHKDDIVKTLRHACENIGFFYLKVDDDSSNSSPLSSEQQHEQGKGQEQEQNQQQQQQQQISLHLIQNVFTQSKKFFKLPTHIKQQFVDSELNRGYTAMGEETLDPSNQSTGDTKEGYYIATDVSKDSELYNPSKLSGPNVWPMQNSNDDDDTTRGEKIATATTTMAEFDLDCKQWKNIMNDYFEKLSIIGFKLVQLLALAIGLSENYFNDKFSPPMAFLRLLHYSKQKSDVGNGVFACGAHSDYGMLTLLATDDQPGLQILIDRDGDSNGNSCDGGDGKQWIDVTPPPLGTFVVNLGDMLERWTNGRFKSTVHRVVSKGDTERYSIPFFYEPNFDTIVECLDVCVGEGETKKYPTTTAGGHLLEKYNQTHSDFQSGD